MLEAIGEEENIIEGVAEAPARFSTSQQALFFSEVAYQNVATALKDAKYLATEDVRLQKWMPLLKELLLILREMQEIPETTALLPNYPNPFNPETWIPYHLAQDANVTLTIYDTRGSVVRELTLGHQAAGSTRAEGVPHIGTAETARRNSWRVDSISTRSPQAISLQHANF